MRAAILFAALAAGCYSPTAPSGSYQCDPSNGSSDACPSGLSCVCGSCVVGDGDEACSFRIDFADDAPGCSDKEAKVCTFENATPPINLTVTAFSASQAPADPNAAHSRYSGSATLGSSWGHLHYPPFHFVNGVAHVPVTLDRATPPNATALITAKQGQAFGQSAGSIIVDPEPLTVDAAAALKAGAASWGQFSVGYPAIDHTASGYTMYLNGLSSLNAKQLLPTLGTAVSTDGITWTAAANPIYSPTSYAYSPSVVRVSDSDVRLFFDQQDSMRGSLSVIQLQSTDNGMTFAPPASMPSPLAPASCPFCVQSIGLADAWAVRDPIQSSVWRLFFAMVPDSMTGRASSTLGVAITDDGGLSWQVDPLPTPGTGQALSVEVDGTPRVAWDSYARIWRMYYARARPNAPLPCVSDIEYATSDDGQFWTGARQPESTSLGPASLRAEDVPWGNGANPFAALFPFVGVVPGAIDVPADPTQPTAVWFTLMSRAFTAPNGRQSCDEAGTRCKDCGMNDNACKAVCCDAVICLPFAIGRATHS